MNAYAYWSAAVAGEKPKMFVDDPQCGFYRKGVYERNDKGNNNRVGWTPVAIFMVPNLDMSGKMIARVGSEADGRDVEGDQLNELWSYVAANAISEGAYREVARHGKDWPDAHDASKNKPEGKTIAQMREENPRFDKDLETTFAMIDASEQAKPENKLAKQIADAKAGLTQYSKIESDEQAGRARSLQSELLGFKGEAVKLHKAEKEPHLEAGRAVDRKWFPLRDEADAGALELRKAMEAWEDFKREQARRAQADADRKAREHEEAVRKAEAANQPPPPPPKSVAPNAPAPATQIVGAVGRKASVKVKAFVVSIDEDKAFAQFKGNAELSALLVALAQKAIDAGLPVLGAVTEDRSVVR